MANGTNKTSQISTAEMKMLGPELSFEAAEAYKMLRTNILFSMTTEEKCHIIGITSTFKGEGKSISSINLAYTFAEAKNRVLLIESDMRMPSLAGRLNLKSKPGLSNLMFERLPIGDVIQRKTFLKQDRNLNLNITFDVLTAGSIPPNPSELIQSLRMQKLLATLTEFYDIIILDLPPVTMVTDAIIASNYITGMVVVVRNEVASKRGLSDVMRQFKQANARVLGFLFTSAVVTKRRSYGKYGKYGKRGYYKGYYRGYYRT